MSLDQFLLSADTTDLNYPEIRPTLDLNFARTKTLDPRITFRRASGGSYVGPDGRLRYAGVNEARFDHDPTTGESLGLLVEESKTNLLLQSENFSTTWVRFNVNASSNAILAPDGTLTADKLTENNATNFHRIRQGITSSVTGVFSVFLKAAERTRVDLATSDANLVAGFDLSNGSVVSGTGSIEPFGDGWYRCSISATFTTSGPFLLLRDSSSEFYTGDGTSGLYIWGAQLEEGSFPTSYIPTEGSTVTRSADVASISGSNFSSWYRQDEGTVYHLYKPFGAASARRIFSLDDGTSDNRYLGAASNGSGSSANYIAITSGGVNQGFLGTGDAYTETQQSGAFAYIVNNAGFSKNGSTASLDSSVLIPTINTLNIGSDFDNASVLNGTIRRLTYWPQRLPNSQLQALTR